jgi:ribose transport system permease protein
VKTRRITFTVMLRMSVVAAALAGMLYAGRLESGRYRWGTGYERSVIAAVILTGIGRGSVIGSLFGSQLIGMINIGFILAGLDVSSGRSWSASSSSSRLRWRGGNDG